MELIHTPRLCLRRWRDSDRPAFAEMSADPEVMRFFPSTMTRTESDHFIDRNMQTITALGYGFFAVEHRETGTCIGAIGLAKATFDAHFTPCMEIGWRLRRSVWGQGYALEGARACLRYGFDTLGLRVIMAFTSELNRPSVALMERLGMRPHTQPSFDHPRVPIGHVLRPHLLYQISVDDVG